MQTSIPWRLVRTLIFSFLFTLLMMAGLTLLLYKFRLSEAQITTGIYAVYIASCLLGGFLSGKAMKTKRFFWGFLTGILYFMVLFAMSTLQEQGITAEPSRILTTFAICAGSGMAGGMVS